MKALRNRGVVIVSFCLLLAVGSLYAAGESWGWGTNWYGQLGDNTNTNRWTPVQTHIVDNLISIDGGCDYSLAAKLDGTVWAWKATRVGS